MAKGGRHWNRRRILTRGDLHRDRAAGDLPKPILIVSEGTKTERSYFEQLDESFHGRVRIHFDRTRGLSPLGVYERAREKYDLEKGVLGVKPYDRVFCVFDRDRHTTYQQALDRIRSAIPAGIFQAVPSVPCFEYWLLLHFVFSTRQYLGTGRESACDRLIKELRKHMPEYRKNRLDFGKLAPNLEKAIGRSRKALREARKAGTDNPSTRVHEVVAYMRELAGNGD